MDQYFNDKVAVITGAGGVICSQVAKDLATEGMTVVLVGRTLEKLEKVAAEIEKGYCYACDVTDKDAVEKLAAEVIERFGHVDYLVNGAGGNNNKAVPSVVKFDPRELEDDRHEGFKGLFNVDMETFESILLLNTMGTFYPTMAFARYMVKQGSGSVVNFASMNSYCPLTRNFAYAMSKAAVVNLTQSMAAYFAEAGIRINAVAPGFIINERSKTVLGCPEEGLTKRGQDVIDHTPQGKFGQAGDMSGCVKFLLDDRASAFLTGVTIPVDGGFLTLSGV